MLLLLGVLGVVAVRLAARLKRGKFGSHLLVKLAGIFALVGLLPGLLIYTVSYQFASRSIEAWFDVRVAGALDAGLALGKGTLEYAGSTDNVQGNNPIQYVYGGTLLLNKTGGARARSGRASAPPGRTSTSASGAAPVSKSRASRASRASRS